MNRKVFCGLLAGAVGVGGLITFGLHRLDDSFDVCADVIMQKAPSPDARLMAIVYSRSCGVFTTGLTTQVTIVKNGDRLPKDLGNVYVERSEYSQPRVSVQWDGSRRLLVEDDPKVIGRDASEAEKRVKVSLGWFRSTDVAVRYADVTGRQAPKARDRKQTNGPN